MKLCYVTQTGFGEPCAELTHAVEIIRALRLLGHEVCVMHAGTRGFLTDLDVQVQKAPFGADGLSKLAFQVWLFARLFFGYRKGHFDCCYVRHSARMLSPSLVARVTGMPVIAEFNACFAIEELSQGKWYLKRVVRYIERHSLRYSSLVVVISDVVRDLMLTKYDIEEDKILVAHNGANTELMKPMPGGSVRHEHGIGEGDFVIGFVGQLHPWQGIDELLEVFRRLHREKSDTWLVIAGTHDDLPRYQRQARDFGIEGKVIFLGPVEYQKIPDVIGIFDVAMAPGCAGEDLRFEMRSPLKVYEYMSCGKPVVAARLGSIEGYFKDRKIGFMVSRGSVDETLEALIWLYDHPNEAQEMGVAARQFAEQELSWNTIAARIMNSFQSRNLRV